MKDKSDIGTEIAAVTRDATRDATWNAVNTVTWHAAAWFSTTYHFTDDIVMATSAAINEAINRGI